MASAQKRFFKRNPSPNPQAGKENQIAGLKEQLDSLHSKIAELEGQEGEGEFEVKTLYEWASPAHVFIPRGKKWLMYVVLLTILIILILVFVREFFIIAPVLAIAFLAYVLASVPPDNLNHKITNQGIITGTHNYLWEELYDFWFTEKHGSTVLNIDTLVNFPARLIMIIDPKEKEKVKSALLRYLPYREVPKTSWMDSLGETLSKLFHKMAS